MSGEVSPMTARKGGAWGTLLLSVFMAAGAPVRPAVAATEDSRYVSNTIRGKLFDPDTGHPMAGATLRFQPIEEGADQREAVTAEDGSYKVEGLGFGRYVLEIVTADGEVIRGVNPIVVDENKKYEVTLKISKRYRSETSVDLDRQRFAVAVNETPFNWKRFWTEFAIFFGAAAAVAVAAD
jgi:hypothetical protein